MRFLFYLLWKQYKCWLLLCVCSSEIEPTQRPVSISRGCGGQKGWGTQAPPVAWGSSWVWGVVTTWCQKWFDLRNEKKHVYRFTFFDQLLLERCILPNPDIFDSFFVFPARIQMKLTWSLDMSPKCHFLHMAWLPLTYFDQTSKWFLQI